MDTSEHILAVLALRNPPVFEFPEDAGNAVLLHTGHFLQLRDGEGLVGQGNDYTQFSLASE